MNRPEPSEYNEYYGKYISLVTEDDVIDALVPQPNEMRAIFKDLAEDKGLFAYADGKWTVKEVISHLIDVERIFAYRVLRIARGDTTPIEGYEQDGYIDNSNANGRSFIDLLDEFDLQRRSNMLFFNNLNRDGWLRQGTASGMGISVRAIAYIMAGHVRHHMSILKDHYHV